LKHIHGQLEHSAGCKLKKCFISDWINHQYVFVIHLKFHRCTNLVYYCQWDEWGRSKWLKLNNELHHSWMGSGNLPFSEYQLTLTMCTSWYVLPISIFWLKKIYLSSTKLITITSNITITISTNYNSFVIINRVSNMSDLLWPPLC